MLAAAVRRLSCHSMTLTETTSTPELISKDSRTPQSSTVCGICSQCTGTAIDSGGRGQIVSGVSFQCTCHYNYIDEQGNRFVYYRQPSLDWHRRRTSKWHERRDSRWRRTRYYEGTLFEGPKIEGRPNMPEPIMAFKLIAGHSKGGRRIGFVINEIGHTMVPLAPFHRLMSNSTELFRCNRWRKVLQETTKFTELRSVPARIV